MLISAHEHLALHQHLLRRALNQHNLRNSKAARDQGSALEFFMEGESFYFSLPPLPLLTV